MGLQYAVDEAVGGEWRQSSDRRQVYCLDKLWHFLTGRILNDCLPK